MSKAKWLIAAGLVTLTAGCVQETTTYRPNTAYRGTYYSNGYYAPNTAQARDRYWNSANRDYDRDGVPNRYDRDANGDRVPDRYQGRY